MRYYIYKDDEKVTGFLMTKSVQPAPAIEVTKEEFSALGLLEVSEEVREPRDLEKENDLLRAQLKAVSDRGDFIEDCIAEMAMQVYGGE